MVFLLIEYIGTPTPNLFALKNLVLWARSEMSGYASKLCNRNNGVME
jgi:hypothetical protein